MANPGLGLGLGLGMNDMWDAVMAHEGFGSIGVAVAEELHVQGFLG